MSKCSELETVGYAQSRGRNRRWIAGSLGGALAASILVVPWSSYAADGKCYTLVPRAVGRRPVPNRYRRTVADKRLERSEEGALILTKRHDYMKTVSCLVARVLLAGGLIAAVAGCTSASREWQEEVQLSDGTVLDVKRTIRYDKVGVPAGRKGSGWIPDGEELTFVDPVTGRAVHWTAHRRLASYLDRVDGRYLIVAAQSRCEPVEDRGQPLWRVYVLTPTGWDVVETSRLNGAVTPNFVLGAGEYGPTQDWSRLTIADKKRLNAKTRVWRSLRNVDPHDPTECS